MNLAKRRSLATVCCLIGSLLSQSIYAADADRTESTEMQPFAVGIAAGTGMSDMLLQSGNIGSTEVLGIDLRWQTGWHTAFDFAEVDAVQLNGHLTHWEGRHEGQADELDIAALTVNWRWQPKQGFFDAGIGAAKLSDTTHEEVKLTSEYQFALDFGAGYAFASGLELSLRYRHYSNGYTDSPNPGLDSAVLLLVWQF